MRTAWLNLVAFGSLTTLLATACVVKTGDDDDDETGGRRNSGGSTAVSGGRGGASGLGGTASGGVSSGGAKTTGGTTATGGTATGTGGKPEPKPYCDGSGPATEPAKTCEYADEDVKGANGKCLSCLSASCCSEIRNCHGTDPSGEFVVNQCGAGGTEYLCYQACLQDIITENGSYDDQVDPYDCADACVRTGCAAIASFTSDVVTCMHLECETECFPL
jgi:hypothetical protein